MNSRHRGLLVFCVWATGVAGLVASAGVAAQAVRPAAPPPPDLRSLPASTPPAAPAPTARNVVLPEAQDSEPARGEPAIKRTVIEDDGARIDELKVRGRSERITVTPKHGPAYEIIPPNSGPDISQGARGSNGAVGKRVWPVLSF